MMRKGFKYKIFKKLNIIVNKRILKKWLRVFDETLKTISIRILIKLIKNYQKDYWIKTYWGDKMLIPVPPFLDILKYGAYLSDPEVRLQKYIIKNIEDNKIIFDVGSCVGYYTLLFSFLSPNGKIFSFEPDINAFNYLFENKRYCKRDNIFIFKIAIADKNGLYNLYLSSQSHIGWSTLYKESVSIREGLKNVTLISVDTTSLDNFCNKMNIYPNFLKIDVEGAENLVLKGSKLLLKEKSPIISMEIEFNPLSKKFVNENYLEALALLEEFGYTPYFISDDGDPTRINSYSDILKIEIDNFIRKQKINFESGYDNLIFIKDSREIKGETHF